MALVVADRVRETTTTTGTGTVTLAGAVTGYQSFSVIGNANTTYYCIAGQGTSEWEVGIGTYTSSGTTLSRDTVLSSSAGAPTKTTFSAGTKDVFVTYPATYSVTSQSPTLVTPALGTPSSGTLSNCTVDGTNGVGYINIPINSKSAAYTTIASDAGKTILHPSADTTARTFTIDSNANVPYALGTPITFVNQNGAGTLTIAINTDTMRLAGAGTTGNRTLAANGIATAVKLTSTEWIISGTGLT